jgi:hypothetical protein
MDRFDLEQQIMECWGITSDLNLIIDVGTDVEEIKQFVNSIKVIYEHKFDRLFTTFETLVADRKIV